MNDVVIIPTWERPEMLYHCIERLSKCELIDEHQIWVLFDARINYKHHLNPQTQEVIGYFKQLDIVLKKREPHNLNGNSFNVMMGMKEAFDLGVQNLYHVEDDVMVSTDFFRWHREVNKLGQWFCSIATQCTRRKDIPVSTNPSDFYVSDADFASLGTCIPRRNLGLIVRHATMEYFNQQGIYIRRHFPNNRFGDCWTEQDGLTMRVMGDVKGKTAWPCVPRAWHCGFWGYNRRDRQAPWTGSGLADKIRFSGQAMDYPAELKKLAGKWEDVFAPDNAPRVWQNLQLISELA